MAFSLVNGLTSDQLNIADRGLSYGDGLFETIQISAGKALLWDAHLARLEQGAIRLKIPFNKALIKAFSDDVNTLLAQADDALKQHSVLKLTLTRGIGKRGYKADPSAVPTRITSLSAMASMIEKQRLGIDVLVCETRLARQSLLSGIKHLNRLEQVIARSEWDDEAITEGIVCDTQGNVIEGCMSNLFWLSKDTLYTPDLSYAGVAGVVRDKIIDLCEEHQLINVEQGDFSLEHLLNADHVFVCNSVFNILPIVRIRSADQTALGTYTIGNQIQALQAHLQQYYLKEA